MTEGQRPRQTARSLGNSLTNELVEQSQSLEQVACLPSNDCIDLRGGHTRRRDQRQIDLSAWRRRDRLIGFCFGSARYRLGRFEVDLQSERGLGPNGCVERQTTRRTDLCAVD